jgi:uncharacterized alpha-E superfamily protein
VLIRLIESSGQADSPELPVLLRAVTYMSASLPGFVGEGAAALLASPEAELLAVIYDSERSGSIAHVLDSLCHVAGMVRDRISRDMWRVVNDLADVHRRRGTSMLLMTESAQRNGATHEREPTLSDALELLDHTVLTLAAFSGLTMDSVTRGDGWRFLDLGRKLERSLHTVQLLRNTAVTAGESESPLLEALLEIADSSMTYRRRYQGSVEAAPVLDLLLADEGNPRSLGFQLAAVAENIEHLPRDTERTSRTAEQRLMLQVLMAVGVADAHQLATVNADGRRHELERLLLEIAGTIPAVSDTVTQTYLTHLEPSRQLSAGIGS